MGEQVVKRWTERHGVDDKFAIACEGQDDDFAELAIGARTAHQHLRRISVGVHVDDDQRMFDSVDHLIRGDPVSTC